MWEKYLMVWTASILKKPRLNPVRHCIVGNFYWYKISCKCIQTLLRKFSFLQNEWVALWRHPYSWWGMPHIQTKETTLNDEANKQNLGDKGLVFLLYGGLHNYESIITAARGCEIGLFNRRIQHCWSLIRQLWSVSYGFVGILYSSSRLTLLYRTI